MKAQKIERIGIASLLAGVMFLNAPVYANTKEAQKKEIEDVVKKTAEYIKTNGKEAAIKEINKKEGLFSTDKTYVFMTDFNGTLLASNNAPGLIGKNLNNMQDPDGKYFNQELIAKAKNGGGWGVIYRWPDPTTQKTECKNTYVISINNEYLIGSGYYFKENSTTHQCEEK